MKSQAGDGWRASGVRYDDGGFSGGSMERPALQRLLADIAAGKIDVVVVYKIDRLTRTLADFVRMVELFDRHEVSFVSVTQAFNTTNSMGRLTLNVLLSFAQFEREVTGERIRDKIAASKAKGMWMGGTLPLGYDLPVAGSRALVANDAEAETVRTIFRTYLELGSVHALERWLAARGIGSKQRATRSGEPTGGQPFNRGALFYMLRNRTYLGMIVHRQRTYPGMHPAIVEAELFDAVQQRLDANARRHAERSDGRVTRAPLTGRIFDADGQPMSPSFTYGRRRKHYRYYVSAPLQQGRRRGDDGAIRRVPGPALEAWLVETVRRIVPASSSDPLSLLMRIEVYAGSVNLLLPIYLLAGLRSRLLDGEAVEQDPLDPLQLRLTLPVRLQFHGGRTKVIGATRNVARPDPALIKALRSAHAMLERDASGRPVLTTIPTSPYHRRLARLAFLAPDLQRAILTGRQPPELTLGQLLQAPMPLLWADQARSFGMSLPG